jgi:AcrR family transcriptional regulator
MAAVDANPTKYHQPLRRPGQKTLERLLAAAEQQLREEDLDAFTIQNVLGRTDLSVGAFYSRFPDKDALLHTVQQRMHERLEPRIMAALADQARAQETLEEAVDHGFGILIEQIMQEGALTRAFMMRSVFDPVMRAKGEQVNIAREAAMTVFLMRYRDEIGHDDPELAINAAYAMYSTVLRGRLMYFEAASELERGVSDDTIFSMLTWTLGRYLRGGQNGSVALPLVARPGERFAQPG